MKRIIQLVLVLFLILISVIVYKIYFSDKKEVLNKEIQKKTNIIDKKTSNQTKNNLIKNLKYEVIFDQDNQYIITADLSEITYQNNIELVKMQKVVAIFIDKNNIPTIITSDKAIYNNFNYNTNFRENIEIKYMDNIIFADKMDLDFDKDTIKIYDNITYNGKQGTIETDVIELDLTTKKIDIYMKNNKDNVKVITNK